MPKIDKRIIAKLQKKLGISQRRVYQLIEDRSTSDLISRDKAAYLIASENRVNVTRLLPEAELHQLRQVKHTKTPATKMVAFSNVVVRRKREIELSVDGVQYNEPLLPPSLTKDAINNAQIYPVVYLFENSVRNAIQRVLSARHGHNWWEKCASKEVKRDVDKRRSSEQLSPWHSTRGAHQIFYTDIGDLKSLFMSNNNSQLFRPILGKLETIYLWIEEIEKTRNTLSHNNPVKKRDRERLLGFAKDWLELLRAKKDLIP